MIIKTVQHHFSCIALNLENYLPMLQHTRLNNVAHCSKVSPEYLEVRVINSVIDELLNTFARKALSLGKQNVKLKLSDAAGIVLYKTLLDFPIDEKNIYLNQVRNDWLRQLNQQIIR